ncbi:unnamed protein product [Protopolystoma xenopodis]|uniref:RanBD1 domain-containing protein n=1 Tax=Protopolystoma xenopodis TaxID=117903 RepID=A0A448WUR5_9PLAT|nr:unnamed protein product [Protopolystoma xenopodis]
MLVQTGEEEEICLFQKRCKLFRHLGNEWKERGLGTIKVLVRPADTTALAGIHMDLRAVLPGDIPANSLPAISSRLLMRREQVLKVCVNQPITAKGVPKLQPMRSQIDANSLCWSNVDYSDVKDGEMSTYAVRFKGSLVSLLAN